VTNLGHRARIEQTGGLYWACFQYRGLNIRLPFRTRLTAVHWLTWRNLGRESSLSEFTITPLDALRRKSS
jgi:hypothetical protein